mmetsp:Transcript_62528/g.134358  ORF Transcript_62528/g.134358 Transcript_62528/m.134358 type:complete len:457 (+) Transcript_62528:32-1402(+)
MAPLVLTRPGRDGRCDRHQGQHRCASFLAVSVMCGAVLLPLLAVALFICWMLTQGFGLDGRRTYQLAAWRFDEGARFDNTFGTWATDYGLAALCGAMALRLCRRVPPSALRTRVVVLLALYAASTGLGGVVHQRHSGRHSALNTAEFRVAWTMVVGATLASGSLMWMIGSELLRLQHSAAPSVGGLPAPASAIGLGVFRASTGAFQVYSLPDMAWLAWGGILTSIAVFGGFSYTRPACDIFVAGTSQALPTFYLQLALLPWRRSVPGRAYWLLHLGLLSNSPLIFVYPWFVQHSGLALGTINAMLHSVLAFSWTLQGVGLTHVCKVAAGRQDSVSIAAQAELTRTESMGSMGSMGSMSSTASSTSRACVGNIMLPHIILPAASAMTTALSRCELLDMTTPESQTPRSETDSSSRRTSGRISVGSNAAFASSHSRPEKGSQCGILGFGMLSPKAHGG